MLKKFSYKIFEQIRFLFVIKVSYDRQFNKVISLKFYLYLIDY